MKLIECDEAYSGNILEIINDSILTSTALYDYTPWTQQTMRDWFALKREKGFPVLGVVERTEDGSERFLGFGSYGVFRIRPAYKYTVEHSLYVHKDHRGRGIGKLILRELISAARARGVHVMVGAIDAANQTSKTMHANMGFAHVGHMPEVGFKFGRWLNLDLYQLTLDTPPNPVDG